jgi:signal transduction histidine kinase
MKAQDVDGQRVRRTAVRVGLLVGAVSAALLVAGTSVLVAVVLTGARPEHHDDGGHVGDGDHHLGHDGDRVVVDVDRVLPWVAVLAVIGIILVTVAAWLVARWAVRPLASALKAQRHFVSDASHELRTPLTALSSRVQILQRRHQRGADIDPVIADLRRDTEAMDQVLTELLMSAEAASTPQGVADARAGLAAVAAQLSTLAQEHDVSLVVAPGGPVHAAMPQVTLTRLCVALTDNAIQHSPHGAQVLLSASSQSGHALIRVRDHGPGIPAQDRSRIFERFARSGENGRRRGFGLGLALVREAAGRYGGSITIEDTSAEGTTFLLSLPAPPRRD